MTKNTDADPKTDATGDEGRKPSRGLMAYMPILIFGILAVVFFYALRSGDPSKLPSALVGKLVPEFDLPALEGLKREDGTVSPGFDAASLANGEVTVVNIWASWCGPCRVEHPFLMELATKTDIEPKFRLVGINYKDQTENARRFLGTLGNPYDAVGVDALGRTSINWGVYGIPETFVIDGKGIVRWKNVGPMGAAIVAEKLMPAIAAAAKGGP
ncbi:Cytochrome c-type biogenesis protein CcmG/DsbE, thiol:disulfide oxidoreductase [hydrothermal vent metagenome]|uniref:Cytochrome c-type biogenesis protein CcmG/DsbE, thiol:disulfide oxidoreductase n=1 Tax=hydrothermal vent metagenome TaxID=652676 RepID=A0A3B0SAT8_9ZZZZ